MLLLFVYVFGDVMSAGIGGGAAVAIGFRSTDATALEWLAAFGLLVLFALALTWVAVGLGLVRVWCLGLAVPATASSGP
jgi:hypothetical protein